MQVSPRLTKWLLGYSHEQGPTDPGQLLTQGAMTRGYAEKVSPQLSLTFNLIHTRECLSMSESLPFPIHFKK